MTERDLHKEVMLFLAAMNEAEENGEDTFPCPICGGQAHMSRAESNGHVHARCSSCVFTLERRKTCPT